jgi:hypothetical protein
MDKEDKRKCCGVDMVCEAGFSGFIDGDTQSWICLICGNYEQKTVGTLDEEELNNYRENYSEEWEQVKKDNKNYLDYCQAKKDIDEYPLSYEDWLNLEKEAISCEQH